jgi:hypothetical protein
VSASEHDKVHSTSLPSTEYTGAGSEKVGGAGALPGVPGETGVADAAPLLHANPTAGTTGPHTTATSTTGNQTLGDKAASLVPESVKPYVPAALASGATAGIVSASEHDKAHTTSLPTTEHVGGGTGAGALPGSVNETGVADATNPALLSGSGMHTGAASTTPHIGPATGALPHDSSVSGPGPHTDLHTGAGNAPFTGTVTTTNHGTPKGGITGPGPHTDIHSALGSHPDNSLTGTTGSITAPANQTLGEKAASYVPDSVKSYLPAALVGGATAGALSSDRNADRDHDGVPDRLESGTHGNNPASAPTSGADIYDGLNSNTGNTATGSLGHPSTGTTTGSNTVPENQTLGEKAASYVPDSVKSYMPAALVGGAGLTAGALASDRNRDADHDGVPDRLEHNTPAHERTTGTGLGAPQEGVHIPGNNELYKNTGTGATGASAPATELYSGSDLRSGETATDIGHHPHTATGVTGENATPANPTVGEKAASYVPESVKSYLPAALVGGTAAGVGAGVAASDRDVNRAHNADDDDVLARLEKKTGSATDNGSRMPDDRAADQRTDDTLAGRIANARNAVVGSAAAAATAASRSAGQAADYGKLPFSPCLMEYGVNSL